MPEYTKKDPEPESSLNDQDLETQLSPKTGLWELAIVFAKLGAIAFGRPAAHIAQIELEIVQRRQWLSREKLLDLLGITNLILFPFSFSYSLSQNMDSRISKFSQNWFSSLWRWLCTASLCAAGICRSHSLAYFTAIIRCRRDRAVYPRAIIYDCDLYWLSCRGKSGCDRRDDWDIFTSVYSRSIS